MQELCVRATLPPSTLFADRALLRRGYSISEPNAFVEQAVVYSTSTTGLSTLTFKGEVVANGGGVKGRGKVMYCIEGDMYIYYK